MVDNGEYGRRNAQTHAVITGGTQGLGLAIAKRLAAEGAPKIAISGRNAERGAKAAAEVGKLGAECVYLPADVSKVDDCHNLIDAAVERFGWVNALVNCAALTTRGTLLNTTPELWEEHINTNARGPFLTTQRLVGHLLDAKRPGSIVNIVSVAAYCGAPFLIPYSASKGALANLTKTVAHSYAHKRIRCNGVMLGWTDTPNETKIQKQFHGAGDDWLEGAEAGMPMGQLIKPHEAAGLVAYMVSPDSGVMTGALVHYDQNVVGAPSGGFADVEE